MSLFRIRERLSMYLGRRFGDAEQNHTTKGVEQRELCLQCRFQSSEFLPKPLKRRCDSVFSLLSLAAIQLLFDSRADERRRRCISLFLGQFGYASGQWIG